MIQEIVMTEAVEQALRWLPLKRRNNIHKKIRLLAENPRVPAFKVHRVKQARGADIWECYLTDTMRLLYEVDGAVLRLWELGSHEVVDNIGERGNFSGHPHWTRL